MRVLLVSPINRTYVVMPNLGLGYLASALKKDGHYVEILHCMKEKFNYGQFADFLKAKNFDVVGFQLFSYDLNSVKKHIKILKEISPSAFIIVGGPHPSGAPLQTMEYLKDVDFGFQVLKTEALPRRHSRVKVDQLRKDHAVITAMLRPSSQSRRNVRHA